MCSARRLSARRHVRASCTAATKPCNPLGQPQAGFQAFQGAGAQLIGKPGWLRDGPSVISLPTNSGPPRRKC